MSADENKQTVIIPPAPPEPGDSRLDSFLLKAAPIIAVERGINAKSRVKLEAIARDMHLPDDMFQQGIHMLQGAPPVDSKRESRWTSAFRQYLYAKLENLPRRILTFRMEARIVAVATSKFQLPEDKAHEIIRIAAKEKEVRRVSQSEAEKYVAHLIQSKVGDAAWLDDKTVTRLHAVGTEWGLSSEQVDAVIRQFTYENRRRQQRERRNTVITLTVAGAVVVALICGLAYAVLRDKGADPAGEVAETTPGELPEKPADGRAAAQRVEAPGWWDADVTVAVSKSRVGTPGFGEIYPLLASDDPAVRSDAYVQLIQMATTIDDTVLAFPRLRQIIVGCYALDPADACAEIIRDALLGLDTTSDDELPQDEHYYESALRSGEIAIAMLHHGDVSDERAESLEATLNDLLEMNLSRNEQEVVLKQKVNHAFLERFYRQLTIAGPAHVNTAYLFYRQLTKLGYRFLEPRDLNHLEAEFMSTIVPAAGDAWQRYQQLIYDCILARDTSSVLKVLNVLTKTDNKELQRFMSEHLVKRHDVTPVSPSPEDVATAVRDALGIVVPAAPKSSRDRWQQLQELADKALDPAAPVSVKPIEVMQKTVETAYLSTLAFALAQQDLGFPIFDQLVEEGVPDITGARADAGEESPFRGERRGRPRAMLGVVAAKRQKLGEHLARLRLPSRLDSATRIFLINQIAQLTDDLEDISTEQANILVFYALANKDEEEFDKTFPYITRLAKWDHFVLALADRVGETNIELNASNRKLFSTILETDVRIGDDAPGWPRQVQRTLMRQVASRSTTLRAGASDPDRHVENAAHEIRQLYVEQAKLLGAPPGEYASIGSPSGALTLLVSRSAERTNGNGTADSARLAAELPHRLKVVDFLADNDLRRTVLLQRLWLELVTRDVARKQPAYTSKVDSLVDQLEIRDRQASDVVNQLYDGEKAILQTWMMLAP